MSVFQRFLYYHLQSICWYLEGWGPFFNVIQVRLEHIQKIWSISVLGFNYASASNFNGNLTKPPLMLGHGWVITSHTFRLIWLPIHSIKPVLIKLVSLKETLWTLWTPIQCNRCISERIHHGLNTSALTQHWSHFASDILKLIFLFEDCFILINISLQLFLICQQ